MASPAADVVIITGMSGAGKSTTAKSLEDLDWYVIENLPPGLLPTMIDLAMRANGTLPRIAAVIDLRSGRAFSTDLESSIRELGSRGVRPRVVFLEASDETLVRRFENVRRPHPLQEDGRVVDGIAAERQRLSGLREEADLVLDTSALNVHELRARMRDFFGTARGQRAARERGLLRLQVRPSGGRRPGRRLPVPAQPALGRVARPAHRAGRAGPRLCAQAARRRGVPEGLHRDAADHLRRVRPAGEAVRDTGDRLYRRQAPQRDHGRADRPPAGGGGPGTQVVHRDLGRE